MRKDLITELQSGYDPAEPTRELYRMEALMNEAAEELNELSAFKAKYDGDPFTVLSKINVNEHIEKKGNLSYLSWAWAWDTLMRIYPDSFTEINRPESGLPYWTDGRTCWVDVSVTIVWDAGWVDMADRTRSEVFPIMNSRNRSIPVDEVTSFDINTALQRAWTKCIARHGLGFYIYAGEDLPKEEADAEEERKKSPVTSEQIEKIEKLYKPDEIEKMLKRMKKAAITMINQGEAEKMIRKRDTSLITDQTSTF